MIFAPPRHGKSELVSRKFPAYYLGNYPNRQVIITSHNAGLATGFCRSARDTFNAFAPGTFQYAVNPKKQSEDDWGIIDGNGRQKLGSMRAFGVGGGMLGEGAHLLICDDPTTGDDSLSPTVRQRVKDWWKGTAMDRLNPGGNTATILMAQRLNMDDLPGWLLETEGDEWEVLTLRAEFEAGDEDDGTGRKSGDWLWPWGFSVKEYESNKRGNPYWWASKYQQRPAPRDGAMFKTDWIENNAVHYIPREVDSRIRWWDRAATEGGGDWTVGLLMCRRGDHYYIEDVVRGQWGSTNRDRIIKGVCADDNRKYPNNVATWGEQEPSSSGVDAAGHFQRLLAPFAAHSERASGRKDVRADGLASAFGRGEVHVYMGPEKGSRPGWYDEFLHEMTTFTPGKHSSGRHDDQVDACSGAFNKLALSEGGPANYVAVSEAEYALAGEGVVW